MAVIKTEQVKQERHDGTREVKFAGAKLLLGDKYYIIPPLSIGQLEQYSELIARARTMQNDHESMIAAMPMMHSAFLRNYPEMTMPELKDMIDLASYNVIALALFDISKIMGDAEPGEEKQPAK